MYYALILNLVRRIIFLKLLKLLEKLIARGHAYVANNSDVMFDVEALRNTANYHAKISTNYKPVHVLKLMKSKKIQWISCFGKCQRKRTKLAIPMGRRSSG